MGRLISEGDKMLICTPLVGRQRDLILEELNRILKKGPDLIEWRIDYFERITDPEEVIALANELKARAEETPMILTIRADHEGGQPIPLSEEEVLNLYLALCRNTAVEYVDYEMSHPVGYFNTLRQCASENGTKIIASYHNFNLTPDAEALRGKLAEAVNRQADVVKIAVMANGPQDVLNLLQITSEARNTLKIPMISIAMGRYGILTRVMGGMFGSAVTFAVGDKGSAPGQIPIEELRTILEIINKTETHSENI